MRDIHEIIRESLVAVRLEERLAAQKYFRYEGELFLRVVPAKPLFKSSMVHEVVNRGDVFAVRLSNGQLTIVPGTATVEHIEL
jgi:ribosomal protein L16/L10AE